MSLKYTVLKALVRWLNIKKRWDLDADKIVEIKKKQNAKVRIPEFHCDDIEVNRTDVMGFPLLKMKHRLPSEKACMFIIGGGMVSAPRQDSVKKALRFAQETGLDVYVPYYPLCTEYPISKSYEMIYETYREMLKDCEGKNISLLGTSSGGNLALGLIPYMNDIGSKLERPGFIMPISPGTCPCSEKEIERMKELDQKDVAIPMSYMFTAETIMRHGQDVPDYMLHLQNGDFSNCPEVCFIYGSDETLYAFAPSFEESMKKYGVKYRMIVGQGMFHCYPVFPICPEAKDGWDMMIRIMKEF